MDVIFPEVVPVNYRIMACARWLVKKGCSDIQQDYVLVAGLVDVGPDRGPDMSDLLVVRFFVLTR